MKAVYALLFPQDAFDPILLKSYFIFTEYQCTLLFLRRNLDCLININMDNKLHIGDLLGNPVTRPAKNLTDPCDHDF